MRIWPAVRVACLLAADVGYQHVLARLSKQSARMTTHRERKDETMGLTLVDWLVILVVVVTFIAFIAAVRQL